MNSCKGEGEIPKDFKARNRGMFCKKAGARKDGKGYEGNVNMGGKDSISDFEGERAIGGPPNKEKALDEDEMCFPTEKCFSR